MISLCFHVTLQNAISFTKAFHVGMLASQARIEQSTANAQATTLLDLPPDILEHIAASFTFYDGLLPAVASLSTTCSQLSLCVGKRFASYIALRRACAQPVGAHAAISQLHDDVVSLLRTHGTWWMRPDRLGDLVGEARSYSRSTAVDDFLPAVFDSIGLDNSALAGLDLDVALRRLLSEMVMPGAPGKLDRIFESFARRYHAANPTRFASSDAVHVLAFGALMLSVDLHSDLIAQRHRLTEFHFMNSINVVEAGGELEVTNLYSAIKRFPLDVQRVRSELRVCREGWLEMRRPSREAGEMTLSSLWHGRQWHRVYGVLAPCALYLYQSSTDSEPLTTIPLKQFDCVRRGDDRFGFATRYRCKRCRPRHVLVRPFGSTLLPVQRVFGCFVRVPVVTRSNHPQNPHNPCKRGVCRNSSVVEYRQNPGGEPTDGTGLVPLKSQYLDLDGVEFRAECVSECRSWVTAVQDRFHHSQSQRTVNESNVPLQPTATRGVDTRERRA